VDITFKGTKVVRRSKKAFRDAQIKERLVLRLTFEEKILLKVSREKCFTYVCAFELAWKGDQTSDNNGKCT
jgi:hypothetical protein